jgi:predicted nucleotidyltransferase
VNSLRDFCVSRVCKVSDIICRKAGLDNKEKWFNISVMDNNIPYIDKIVPIIISIAAPDQIILFGSYARGDNTEKSDIDLLIIKKELKNSFDIIDSIDRAFYENKIRIPIDLLAIDYTRYNELNSEIGYIYKTIKEEGKVIYGTL